MERRSLRLWLGGYGAEGARKKGRGERGRRERGRCLLLCVPLTSFAVAVPTALGRVASRPPCAPDNSTDISLLMAPTKPDQEGCSTMEISCDMVMPTDCD